MEHVVNTLSTTESQSLYRDTALQVQDYVNLYLVQVDKECCSNVKEAKALFQELHGLILAHFQAACFYHPITDDKYVPAYVIGDHAFTVYDLERLGSGGE